MILLDNPIPRDWFDWTNFAIGLFGLAFTLWAVRQATGAKQAATEAKKAIWKRTASDAFKGLATLGSLLDSHIYAQRMGESYALLSQLRSAFTEARNAFELELADMNQQPLDEIEGNLRKLSGWLQDPKTFDEHLQDAKTAAAESSATLSGIAGQLQQRER